jgi:hypothetical protein
MPPTFRAPPRHERAAADSGADSGVYDAIDWRAPREIDVKSASSASC